MTDLSSLSDAELTALFQKQSASSGAATDLSKMSDDELKAAYAASAKPAQTDTSIGGALAQGASSVVQGYGKTIKDYINKDAGAAVESAGAAKARPNYKSATENFMRPEDGADKHTLGVDWSKLPRMLVEQAPGLAVDLGVQAIVPKWMGPIGKYAANALSFGGRTAGAEAEKRAVERTGDPNAEPSGSDKLVALGSTAAQTALNQYGLNKIVSPAKVTAVGLEGAKQAAGNVAKAALAEGGTNAAQNLISQGAAKAGTSGIDTIDWQEVKANAAAGGALGGVFSAPKGAREASIATRLRNSTDEHSVMAANRIKENGSVDAAKQDIHTELSRAAEGVTDPTPETDNALVRAKSGGKLTAKDLDAIDAVGDDQLSSLVRQATALSKMSDKPGGLSGKAEGFVKSHPLWALGSALTPHAVAASGFLPAFAASLPGAGALAAAAGTGYAGLRAFDSLMGLRDKGNVFAEKIGDGTGKVRPDAPPPPEPSEANLLQAQHTLESGLQKMTDKLQGQKRQEVDRETREAKQQATAAQREAERTARELRQRSMDDQRLSDREARLTRQQANDAQREADRAAKELKEQAREKLKADDRAAKELKQQAATEKLLTAERLKAEGQRRAEQLAAEHPLIKKLGGLDAVRNPALGKRANELLSTANALRKLTKARQEAEEAQAQPQAPTIPQPKSVDTRGATPQSPREGESIVQQALAAMQAQRGSAPQEDFVLPESPYWHLEPAEASQEVLRDALQGGKNIRHPEGYRANTQRRMAGEDAIWNAINDTMPTHAERSEFAKYFKAMRGSSSPEVMEKVRDAMLAEFPQHADAINKHLTDEKIKSLWTKEKKKKA